VMSYNDVFRLCGLVFALSIPTVFLLSPKKAATKAPLLAE
jgi:hypothetical protein